MLAKVSRLHTISATIPVYVELVKTMQELIKAIHKFHITFNEQIKRLVDKLGETKGQREGVHVWSHYYALLTSNTIFSHLSFSLTYL
jgi:hypothetical protein